MFKIAVFVINLKEENILRKATFSDAKYKSIHMEVL